MSKNVCVSARAVSAGVFIQLAQKVTVPCGYSSCSASSSLLAWLSAVTWFVQTEGLCTLGMLHLHDAFAAMIKTKCFVFDFQHSCHPEIKVKPFMWV